MAKILAPFHRIKLDCGHLVHTTVTMSLQRTDDVHLIFCPACRNINKNPYGRGTESAWRYIVSDKLVTDEYMSKVLNPDAYILHRDILRLQPSVPPARNRPFPYTLNGGRG